VSANAGGAKTPMMKFLTFLVRIALGAGFLIAGLDGFFHFFKQMSYSGPAADFLGAMNKTHYLYVIKALEVIGGALLLLNRVPLGLTLIGPVVVNIVLFHIFMNRTNLPTAVLLGAMSLFLLWRNQEAFPAIFPKTKSEPAKKPAKK
jgi:putative oxidoreductase